MKNVHYAEEIKEYKIHNENQRSNICQQEILVQIIHL